VTHALDNVARPSRMVRPNIEGISVPSLHRPVDYGHCHMLLVEKYGPKGDSSYEHIALNGTNAIWTVATDIVKEKIKMLDDLGRPVPAYLFDVHWFELWQEWRSQNLHRKG